MFKNLFLIVLLIFIFSFTAACSTGTRYRGDYPFKESNWIREGKPLVFEDTKWYPTDDVENLLDREMEYMGEYESVPFYIEKRDVRPFQRLYTKFGYHKFRVFSKRKPND